MATKKKSKKTAKIRAKKKVARKTPAKKKVVAASPADQLAGIAEMLKALVSANPEGGKELAKTFASIFNPVPAAAGAMVADIPVVPEPVAIPPAIEAPAPVAVAAPVPVNVEAATPAPLAPPVPATPVIEVVDVAGDDEKKEDAAPKFNYRGKIVDIADLVGKVNGGLACEVVERQIPETQTKSGKVGGVKMPTLIILKSVDKSLHGDGFKQITYSAYLNNFKNGSQAVPNDFKVKQLIGKQGEVMIAKFDDEKLKHLNLGYVGQIGSDPEIFVETKSGDVLPAFTFLGSKQDTKVLSKGAMGNKKVYWDGYQAEFETQPNTCLAYHIDSVQAGLKAVQDAARVKDKDAKLSTKTIVEIPYEALQQVEDRFVAFGCMPSLNIYGLTGKETHPRELTFRPSGGHLHFGIGKQTPEKISEGVKALDAILGVAAVSLFRSFDNPIRREYYGLPGEYRLPPHGMEYRTLSSAWLMHPLLAHMMFMLGRAALMFGMNGYRKYWKATDQEVIETIQNCDANKAVELLERNSTMLKRIIASTAMIDPGAYDKRTTETAYKLLLNGCEEFIKTPENISGNWHLDGGWIAHSEASNAQWAKVSGRLLKGEKV